jgi:Kef-type K+ transport system membrane component KefB
MTHALQVLLLLALVIGAAKMAAAAANRIGQPAVFGEILVGLLLGPTLLDVLGWPLFAGNSGELGALIGDLAEIGVLLLMFVAGLETDLEEMRRVGTVAFWAAFGGVILPFFGGIATAAAFGLPVFWEGVFIGTILTATSVSISAQTLIELGALRTREGSTILGAAVIDDVMGILVLSVVVATAGASADGFDLAQIGWLVIRMTAFFVIAIVAGRWFTPLLRWVSGGRVRRRGRGNYRLVPRRAARRADAVQEDRGRGDPPAHLLHVRADLLHQHRARGEWPRAW